MFVGPDDLWPYLYYLDLTILADTVSVAVPDIIASVDGSTQGRPLLTESVIPNLQQTDSFYLWMVHIYTCGLRSLFCWIIASKALYMVFLIELVLADNVLALTK